MIALNNISPSNTPSPCWSLGSRLYKLTSEATLRTPWFAIWNPKFRLWLNTAILLTLMTGSRAEPVLSLVFDDPAGQAATVRDVSVASGTGGEARLRLEEADWADPAEAEKSFQIMQDSAMGTQTFLRLIRDKENPGTRGVHITPVGPEASLAAISRYADGKVSFNGALDMFFRYNEELPSQQELVPNLLSIGGGRLRLVVEADSGTVVAIIGDDKETTSIDTDLDGTADAARVRTLFVKGAPIDPDAPYHLALAFETADTGVVSLKVFLRPGTGAIDTKQTEDLVSQVSFSVITQDPETLLEGGSFSIGAMSRTSPAKTFLDIAAFRIFIPSPAIFPDISGKE